MEKLDGGRRAFVIGYSLIVNGRSYWLIGVAKVVNATVADRRYRRRCRAASAAADARQLRGASYFFSIRAPEYRQKEENINDAAGHNDRRSSNFSARS